MGLYIPNMEMPKSCYLCTFGIIDPTDGSVSGCVVGHIQRIPLDQDRADDCPLIEIDLPDDFFPDVVRCGECKYYRRDFYNMETFCTYHKWANVLTTSEEYCSHGKRKEEKRMMAEICTDNRFVIIDRAKEDLIKSTNIESSPEEMAVLDNILFRCWQMGWLDRYKDLALDEAKEFNDMLERTFTETPIIEAEQSDFCSWGEKREDETVTVQANQIGDYKDVR